MPKRLVYALKRSIQHFELKCLCVPSLMSFFHNWQRRHLLFLWYIRWEKDLLYKSSYKFGINRMHCICVVYELMVGWWTYSALKRYLTGIQFPTFTKVYKSTASANQWRKQIKGENKENNFEISMKETRRRLAQELNV